MNNERPATLFYLNGRWMARVFDGRREDEIHEYMVEVPLRFDPSLEHSYLADVVIKEAVAGSLEPTVAVITAIRLALETITNLTPHHFDGHLRIDCTTGIDNYVITNIGRISYAVDVRSGRSYTRKQLIEMYTRRGRSAVFSTRQWIESERFAERVNADKTATEAALNLVQHLCEQGVLRSSMVKLPEIAAMVDQYFPANSPDKAVDNLREMFVGMKAEKRLELLKRLQYGLCSKCGDWLKNDHTLGVLNEHPHINCEHKE